MEMARAQHTLAPRAHATANEIEAKATDVALCGHLRPRENAKRAHLSPASRAAVHHHGFFLLLSSGRTRATVHATIAAHPLCPGGENCGGVCEP